MRVCEGKRMPGGLAAGAGHGYSLAAHCVERVSGLAGRAGRVAAQRPARATGSGHTLAGAGEPEWLGWAQ